LEGTTIVKKTPSTADSAPSTKKSATGFLRTVLGDLPATGALGVCDAHEHVVMRGDWLAEHFPEFVLADLDQTLVDLRGFRAAGGGWIVDSMPTGAGRDAALLAQAAQRSNVPIVCPTGVHQSRYYPPKHPLIAVDCDWLAELFVREITAGIDDGAGTLDFCAGVIKVASDGERLTSSEIERFVAAALAQRRTGCPILTHTAGGRDAYEQVAVLIGNGATPSQVVLSHCDKNADAAYHRELLEAGVCLEYDQHFRQLNRGERCVAVDLIVELVDEFPHQLLVGMDMARQKYWRGYGGTPGLAWLLTDLLPMLRRAGVTDQQLVRISVENAVRAYAFRPPR
jgi:phosphotriesterase-related protein